MTSSLKVNDNLGVTILDEPAVEQTDPTILNMRLRNQSKDTFNSDPPVKRLDRAEKKSTEIDQWINSIKVLVNFRH